MGTGAGRWITEEYESEIEGNFFLFDFISLGHIRQPATVSEPSFRCWFSRRLIRMRTPSFQKGDH